MLRFLENGPGLRPVLGVSAGEGLGFLTAALSGASACLVLIAALGIGDVPLFLIVAAIVSCPLFALGAVVMSRAAVFESKPAGETDTVPAPVEAAPMTSATSSTILIDDEAVVRARFDFAGEHCAPLAPGDRMLDRIHVGDRVALLRAVSRVRSTDAGQVGLIARFDSAAPGDRQSFAPAAMILSPDATGGLQVLMARDVEAVSADEPPAVDIEGGRLAMVSHELRTPLNAIIGFADLVRGDALGSLPPGRQREYADLIHDAASHLLSVVNAMLDVSKIGAGRYTINRESFDLNRTVRDAAMMIAPRAEAKGVHLNLHLEKAVAPAHADRRAVRQIVTNLLSNAIKFTPEHGCVTVDAETSPDTLVLTVSDTGIGIAPDDIEKLGRPYAQIDNSYTRQCEGTGLGLSLVKGLAGLHGGRMRIESTPEIGTRVTVSMPQTVQASEGSETKTGPVTELRSVKRDVYTDHDKEIADAPRLFG